MNFVPQEKLKLKYLSHKVQEKLNIEDAENIYQLYENYWQKLDIEKLHYEKLSALLKLENVNDLDYKGKFVNLELFSALVPVGTAKVKFPNIAKIDLKGKPSDTFGIEVTSAIFRETELKKLELSPYFYEDQTTLKPGAKPFSQMQKLYKRLFEGDYYVDCQEGTAGQISFSTGTIPWWGTVPIVGIAVCRKQNDANATFWTTFDKVENIPKDNLIENKDGQLLAVSPTLQNTLKSTLKSPDAQRMRTRARLIKAGVIAATALGAGAALLGHEPTREYIKSHAVWAIQKGIPES